MIVIAWCFWSSHAAVPRQLLACPWLKRYDEICRTISCRASVAQLILQRPLQRRPRRFTSFWRRDPQCSLSEATIILETLIHCQSLGLVPGFQTAWESSWPPQRLCSMCFLCDTDHGFGQVFSRRQSAAMFLCADLWWAHLQRLGLPRRDRIHLHRAESSTEKKNRSDERSHRFHQPAGEGCQILSQLFSSSASASSSSTSSSLSSSFSSTTFASTPMFTSALPTLRQALRQLPHAVGTAGPQLQGSERTGHRWTSTWDLPSSVSTAGPQPGTVRAHWAPLDLNLGPSELSEHRWTSTAR